MRAHQLELMSNEVLLGVHGALSELGISPEPLLRRFNISPGLLKNPAGFISKRAVIEFIEAASAEFDCPHFGLLVGKHQPNLCYGLLTPLMKASPNVGVALRNNNKHFKAYSQGVDCKIHIEANYATVIRTESYATGRNLIQHHLAAISHCYKLLRSLLGDSWRPTSISFSHSAPKDDQHYKRILQAPVYFEQEFYGITFPSRDLDKPIATADEKLLQLIEKHIETLEHDIGEVDDICTKVLLIIKQMLGSKICTLESVARDMSIHPKALQRELKKRDTTFKELLKRSRNEIAEYYLRNSNIQLTQLSEILSYSSLSALSRAFKEQYGISPEQWRREHK